MDNPVKAPEIKDLIHAGLKKSGKSIRFYSAWCTGGILSKREGFEQLMGQLLVALVEAIHASSYLAYRRQSTDPQLVRDAVKMNDVAWEKLFGVLDSFYDGVHKVKKFEPQGENPVMQELLDL